MSYSFKIIREGIVTLVLKGFEPETEFEKNFGFLFPYDPGEKVVTPKCVTIEENAFAGTLIKEIEMPFVFGIRNGAFKGCKELKKVTIYGGCKLGEDVFEDCDELEEIVVIGDKRESNKLIKKIKKTLLPHPFVEVTYGGDYDYDD